MFEKTERYKPFDTIFYQGANCTQSQVVHYTGGKRIHATTGEWMWGVGINGLKPLNVIYNVHLGPEIADVNLHPFSTYYDYINPMKWLYTSISWSKNYFTGVNTIPSMNRNSGSVYYHSPNPSQISYGQESDIESHHRKYLSWKNQMKNDGLVLYGVSRGTAATFCAFAKYKYPEVKLVILEGAIDSMENVIKNMANHYLGKGVMSDIAVSSMRRSANFLTRYGLFGYKDESDSPLSMLDNFPENVPVIFITSELDRTVDSKSTENIAKNLHQRGKNDVYLLKLKNSRHPFYPYDNKQDHDQYETFIHAIYKEYGLDHDSKLAENGRHLLESCNLKNPPNSLETKLNHDSNDRDILSTNLEKLNISGENINNILLVIDKMPSHSKVYKALIYLSEYKNKSSMCEKHYIHSDYIAEYFCTLTNIGFFAVGIYYQDYLIVSIALFSTLSHAIPLRRLNELDKIAAVSTFINVLSNYQLLSQYPSTLIFGIATFIFGVLDQWVGRKDLDKYGSFFHCAWHLTAAFALFNCKQLLSNTDENDLEMISSCMLDTCTQIMK
ncbi:prolyl oligopeptidase family serine peptidase [Legionella waltersii]|uniref:Peptidase S9 prolyl oligopeptidase catalytic domain-containing protein n=1 Tax=Legionella waltersii TaxID=66969 RepID=A0A0W1A3B4_9GAMM|nr:prolyl oligopeptidase family serine peptidase [Legionella waltersii]KTD75491.1 hypothetical protein Lwal_2429 [Legionella waltersii]SNU98299.1 Uncharacterised protein [Legionella waltersii]